MYPNYVVLMTHRFMYEARDNCARVLSYLMNYKLVESQDGTLTSAGPDKDKIVACLKAHHINYLISEYGEVTSRVAYEDNGYGKYLAVAEKLSPAMLPPVTKTDAGPGKALITPGAKKEEAPIPEWLKPGLKVGSKAFGYGTVDALDKMKIIISFPDVGKKTFIWPDAFDMGFLTRLEEEA